MNTTQESAWFAYTESQYYHRVRAILLEAGMGEGDVENILANLWEAGYLAGVRAKRQTK